MHDYTCPKCSAPLHEDDFNLKLGVAKCQHCSAWSPIDLPERAAEESPRARNKNVPIPAKFQIEENYDELTISWKWYSPIVFFLIPFCIFWNGFLVVWYGASIFMASQVGPMAIVMMLFPLLHVAVGVGLTYFVVATLFNRTFIRIRYDQLSIKHGPIPWWGQHELHTRDLKQLYCTEKVRHGKNGVSISYDVQAMLDNGRELTLLSGLNALQEAVFLEHKIETHLGIEDEPVEGEVN